MGVAKGKRSHVLAVPFPAQGHVTPLFKLSRLIASHGVKVTFVNTHFIHNKIARAAITLPDDDDHDHLDHTNNVVMSSISDGLDDDDDRSDGYKLWESLKSRMTGNLIELVEKINGSDCDEKISCILADVTLTWILEIAPKFGAESVGFTPASAASLAITLQIPNLIQQGNLDSNGTLTGREILSLSDDIPPWRKDEFSWSFPIDLKIQKIMLECCLNGEKSVKSGSNWLLCNTFYEIESSACDMNPKLLPIGPLLKNSNCNLSRANYSSFSVEDTCCLSWLDEKAAGSVIYVSFGSLAVFSSNQLEELALGLELSGRPFLWVVRSNPTNDGTGFEYPKGVCGGGLGKVVEWAPQEEVLSHPSVGCFMSHCGWNSTLEGLGTGVTFLCWPYFADQYHNQNYICDKWKIGLRIEQDENGIRSRDEIKMKIEMLVDDHDMVANALRFKEMATRSVVAKEGSSFMNFQRFINYLME